MKRVLSAFGISLWLASLVWAQGADEKGFVSLFDGKTTQGWHASALTGHSGKSGHKSGGRWVVENGAIVGSQDIPGNGGIFLTDQQFGDFEVVLEMNNDFGPDSGLFLRCTEDGKCYQAMIDYHGGGNLMGIYGEGLGGKPHLRNFSFLNRPDTIKQVTECNGAAVPTPLPITVEQWPKFWKHGQWNELRARIVGNPPHITTWIKDVKFMEWSETVKRHPDRGSIGLQVHGGGDFTKQFVRYRNIRIKSLDGSPRAAERRLPLSVYRDKMQGGWLGQMAGVGWGAPTEFRWKAQIIPADKMPPWNPAWINQHGNDDLYVEMTFLKTLEDYGLDVSIRQAGIDFANSGYQLWHANAAGRQNLVRGIAPPDSGHPKFNRHADDIDYQIEADYSGLIAPGMPSVPITLGEVFGRLMNYGDGLYGGQFVGGMYAEAFFETDPQKIIEAGLRCIPEQCQYAECIRDVLRWHAQEPNDWQKTWQNVEDKYQKNSAYRRASCDKRQFNIDAKINGAYIAMGLLYGNRDPDQTIIIACRCGQDSDCNPANAGGVLFTTLGAAKVPARFTEKLRMNNKFSYSTYTLPKVYEVCEKLVRQVVVRHGGRIEKDANGEEVLVIPAETPRPTKLEQCWEPSPAAESRFTPEEMSKIKPPAAAKNNL